MIGNRGDRHLDARKCRLKSWLGANTLVADLPDKRLAGEVIAARADMVGTALDSKCPKKWPDLDCKECNKGTWDTLHHAVLECKNSEVRKARKTMNKRLKVIMGKQGWRAYKKKSAREKLRHLLGSEATDTIGEEEVTLSTWEALGPVLRLVRERRMPELGAN
jgi:hypothetical protein